MWLPFNQTLCLQHSRQYVAIKQNCLLNKTAINDPPWKSGLSDRFSILFRSRYHLGVESTTVWCGLFDMDRRDERVQELHEALSVINLQPSLVSEGFEGNWLLLGKILITRIFRRYTISEIITKIWGSRIQIENLGQKIFKFVFVVKAERDRVYRGRPWCINGAHLIFKEWLKMMAINKAPFDTMTFTLQIHGLPPMFFYTGLCQTHR